MDLDCGNIATALLFLLGSVLFTIDGVVYLVTEVNIHSVLYTTGSFAFAVGSALNIKNNGD
jgi:hypothetical protein